LKSPHFYATFGDAASLSVKAACKVHRERPSWEPSQQLIQQACCEEEGCRQLCRRRRRWRRQQREGQGAQCLDRREKPARRWWRDPDRILEGGVWQQLRRYNIARPDHDALWQNYIGVNKQVFDYICDQVRYDIEFESCKNESIARSVEERVCIGLFKLHTGETNFECEIATKASKSACGIYTLELVDALNKWEEKFIYLPDEREMEQISSRFEALPNSQMPCCVGAIDGTHFQYCTKDLDFFN